MTKRWLQIGALVLVVAAAVIVLVAPSYSSVTSSSNGGEVVTTQTALEVNGPWLLLPLMVVIAVAALPLFARGRAWVVLSIVSASLLWVFVILGMFTNGVLFAPAALLALIAACLPVRARHAAVA
jgi:hypothetical protein